MADLKRDGSEYFTVGEYVSTSDQRFDYRDTHRDNYLHHDGHGRRWHGDPVGDGHGEWGGADRNVFLQRQQRCGGTIGDADVANGKCDLGGDCAGGGFIRIGIERQRRGDTAADYDVCVDCNWPWWKRDTVRHSHGNVAATERILLGQLHQHHSRNTHHPRVADLQCDFGDHCSTGKHVRIAAGRSISGVTPQQTTTYVLTATGAGGSTSQSVIVNVAQAVPPTIGTFTATPATVNSGGLSTLSWTTTNAVSVSISPNPLDGGESGTLPLSGSTPVTPTTTTQYTLTAMGAGNLTATATATVTVTPMTLSLSVSPARIIAGQAATLTWQTSGGVTGLTIDNNACGATACALPNGSATVQPLTTTTYTATATGAGGTITQAAVVTVSKTTPGGSLKHIVFMVQENRSFDNYFGMLGPYRAQRLQPFGISAAASDVDGLNCTDANCSNITLLTRSDYPKPNAPVHPFHFTTACTENLTPSWDESHYDVHITGTTWQQTTQPGWVLDPTAFKMDNFLQTTSSITQVNPNDDPNGTRPLGYYDQTDLPFYYDLATFFSTSDRWFSPILANTIPNRMYLFAATSFGHVFPDNPPPGGFSPQTILRL